ncbi:hypothetical protein CLV78_101217 [Aliiruegeria haliotis]|uniref:Uncharacterized protein n=1 Tax=Aliiruegeria haliotis TaxID=1280846 RepID=A0A2T0RY63_9RHOB|nr:hypothetical protein [Aliiruegeria haliotis]PRY26124.1 hypothetical protein CLV78_101217 [Aliiruegeria haliotis]
MPDTVNHIGATGLLDRIDLRPFVGNRFRLPMQVLHPMARAVAGRHRRYATLAMGLQRGASGDRADRGIFSVFLN